MALIEFLHVSAESWEAKTLVSPDYISSHPATGLSYPYDRAELERPSVVEWDMESQW